MNYNDITYENMKNEYKEAVSRNSVKYLMSPEYRKVIDRYFNLITAYYEYRTKTIYIIYSENKHPRRIMVKHDDEDISSEELDVLLSMRRL